MSSPHPGKISDPGTSSSHTRGMGPEFYPDGQPLRDDVWERNPERSTHWEFEVLATVECHNQRLSATDVIGSIAFDKSNEFFATGGIARKIRVYSYQSFLSGNRVSNGHNTQVEELEEDEESEEDDNHRDYPKQRGCRRRSMDARRPKGRARLSLDHARGCVAEICTPAKLSSVKWPLERADIIGCGDYDGVVAEWDLEKGLAVSERDEHSGQRIWSIDYSTEDPNLCASASDDGTVRMWRRDSDECVALIAAPNQSPVCSAEFGPSSSFVIALACADSNVYVYDLRKIAIPILTLQHHRRAASNVRFLSRNLLVSASIDSTLKLWDISTVSSCTNDWPSTLKDSERLHRKENLLPTQPPHPVRTFGTHHNVRNFVGLSVWPEGGLIACGSETNEAFAYDCHKINPILRHHFGKVSPVVSQGEVLGSLENPGKKRTDYQIEDNQSNLMVSAICWRTKQSECALVAANSDGVLCIIGGHRI